MTTWGIRNDLFGEELFTEGFVSIGWGELGDLAVIGSDQESLKAALVRAYPDAKPGAIPVWAGVLRRFAFEMQVGDHLIAPYKADGTLNFGVVAGPYEYRAEFGEHPHRRRVKWVQTGVPRGVFPQPALYELGASMTLFKVAHNEEVFADYFTEGRPADDDTPIPDAEAGESADEWAREEPNATKLEQFTRDFVLRTLVTDLDHREFEEFTGALLRAMGYQARVTQFTADGGIDLIAHRDPLGLEPPTIKVQCKHTTATQSRPDVQKLLGTLAHGEFALYVALGKYSPEARGLERERQELRLLGGEDVVDLTLQHYEQLAPSWRARIPLRSVYVIDRDSEGRL